MPSPRQTAIELKESKQARGVRVTCVLLTAATTTSQHKGIALAQLLLCCLHSIEIKVPPFPPPHTSPPSGIEFTTATCSSLTLHWDSSSLAGR